MASNRTVDPQFVKNVWDLVSESKKSHLSCGDIHKELIQRGLFAGEEDRVKKDLRECFSHGLFDKHKSQYGIPLKLIPEPRHDWYCFSCHAPPNPSRSVVNLLKCTAPQEGVEPPCARVYHAECYAQEELLGRQSPPRPENFVCAICRNDQLDFNGVQGCEKKDMFFSQLLHQIANSQIGPELTILPNPQYPHASLYQLLIARPMDVRRMQAKVQAGHYRNRRRFLADYQLVVHNVIIWSGGRNPMVKQVLDSALHIKQQLYAGAPIPPVPLPPVSAAPSHPMDFNGLQPSNRASLEGNPRPNPVVCKSELPTSDGPLVQPGPSGGLNPVDDGGVSVEKKPKKKSRKPTDIANADGNPEKPKKPKKSGKKENDDAPIVSSSSEAGSSGSTVAVETQTDTIEEKLVCDCEPKFKQILIDLQTEWVADFEEERDRCCVELHEKLEAEFESRLAIKANKIADALKEQYEKNLGDLERIQKDFVRKLNEKTNKMEAIHKQQISEVKKKQWCNVCERDSVFHCCWNTSYCTTQCQELHWPSHRRQCKRKKQNQPGG